MAGPTLSFVKFSSASPSMANHREVQGSDLAVRDGNFYPIRGYPVWPDLNGPDFTRSDKE